MPFRVVAVLWVCLALSPLAAIAGESLTLAVASSFYEQAAMRARAFERVHGIAVRLVVGASGRLFNQIQHGAPFDLFVSADAAAVSRLQRPFQVVARGFLGLRVHDALTRDLGLLLRPEVRHIAIPDPQLAPMGAAARAVLEKAGLWRVLARKFVFARNALHAQSLVERGWADAGFVPVAREKPHLASVRYTAVLLTDSDAAKRLYAWLGRPTGELARAGVGIRPTGSGER